MDNNLRHFRKRSNLTFKKAAELIDVHYITIWRWEKLKACPEPELWERIQKAYGLTDDEKRDAMCVHFDRK